MEQQVGRLISRRFSTKAAAVVDELRRLVIRGDVKPGERLREEQLAAELGVSTTPVREALHQLEAEGLVSRVPHKGVVVTSHPLEELKELFQVHGTLQSLAVRMNLPKMTDDEIGEAERLHERITHACANHEYEEMRWCNYLFHMLLCGSARPFWLTRIVAGLWIRFPTYGFESVPRLAEQTVVEHERIIRAVRARDVEAATEAMALHLAVHSDLWAQAAL